MQIQAAGIPWFAEDDYASFRGALPDRAWHPTYAQWLAAAQRTEQSLRQRNIVTVKAHVRAAEFIAWCRASGVDVNTQALTAFANEAAMRIQLGGKGN